jgi:threonine/homoserine efflux transporter RhtA
MTLYLALDRIPLGVAVTLEFAGPLGVAVAGSRRLLDLVWAVLAAAGILLLAPLNILEDTNLDPVGVALALLAGCFWASYILLSARTGSAFPGGTGLVIALCVGTVALIPVGIAGGGMALLDPGLLLTGFGVAMLSSAIPYSLEMEAPMAPRPRLRGAHEPRTRCRLTGGLRRPWRAVGPPRPRGRRVGHRRGRRRLAVRGGAQLGWLARRYAR